MGWVWVIMAAMAGGSAVPLDDFLVPEHRCGAAVAHCFGLEVFVAVLEPGGPAFPAARFAAQLRETERHFAPLGIAFEVAGVQPIAPQHAILRTRKDRTALGKYVKELGKVPVFLVRELHDVDRPGEIRGVHWRDPARRGWSWIVLGTAVPSSDRVLTHELGHFFDLPHGRDPASLMNKSFRPAPPPSEWSFVASERAKIARTLARHLAARKLVGRPRPAHGAGGG